MTKPTSKPQKPPAPKYGHSKKYYAKPFAGVRTCYLFPKNIEASLAFSYKKLMEKRGFDRCDIVGDWEKIVGKNLSDRCSPLRITGKGSKSGAKLHIKTDSATAVELQYQEPIILERLNMFYGYQVAQKIAIMQ